MPSNFVSAMAPQTDIPVVSTLTGVILRAASGSELRQFLQAANVLGVSRLALCIGWREC